RDCRDPPYLQLPRHLRLMRILIAPQEYKGTLTAVQAAEAMAAGVRLAAPKGEMDIAPMADGGPGTAAALIGAAGGAWRRAAVLGFRLLDRSGRQVGPGGAALAHLARIERVGVLPALAEAEIVAATDVQNPLLGAEGASAVYGPQKGADGAAIAELDAALGRLADVIEHDLGVDVRAIRGGGAAGGLGAGCVAFLRAELRSGAAVVGQA